MKIVLITAVLILTCSWAGAEGSKKYCFNLLKTNEVAAACGKKGLISEDWNMAGADQCNIMYKPNNQKLKSWLSLRESNKHESLKDAKIWYDYTKTNDATDIPGVGDAAWVGRKNNKTVLAGVRKKDRVLVLRSENNLCSIDQLKKLVKTVTDRIP